MVFQTKSGKSISVTELTASELLSIMNITNSALVNAMMKVDGCTDYKFYKASYRFGDKVISNGKCFLPLSDGGTISFDDVDLPDNLRNDLMCSKELGEDPLGFIVNKTSEFYLPGNDGLQPHSIIQPGNMFGITRATDNMDNEASTSVLERNLNAGARSLFMLSKISDKTHHVRIQREYGTTIPAPSVPQEHWDVFVEITSKANSDWRCEIIYFSREWINQLKNDEWALIAMKLISLHRTSYSVLHKSANAWKKAFDEIDHQRRLTSYNPQSLEMARQLFMIAANAMPGFKPSVNDDSAPIGLLNRVYNEIYNKADEEKNSAITMEPAWLNKDDRLPIYYSINYTPFSQENLQASNKRSQISLQEDIRKIVETYHNTILETKSDVQSLYDIAKHTKFSFYHSDPGNYPKIYSSRQLSEEDSRFVDNQSGDFPSSSTFFRGCVKIERIS